MTEYSTNLMILLILLCGQFEKECMVEWFHYQCVSLSAANPPPTSWLCPTCTQKKRRGQF